MTIASLLVDFDGTACPINVADELCRRFAAPGWQLLDEAVLRQELTLREAIDRQTPTLGATRGEMLRFVTRNYRVAAGFVTLTRWAQASGLDVAVVSDGFGFYIEPMLAAAGLGDVPVLTNVLIEDASGKRLAHPHGHPECAGCGTCKMQAILHYRRRGPVAFVGEGASDRYAAVYADVAFAKDRLTDLCVRDGVDYLPWLTFDDVRRTLDGREYSLRDGEPPALCPGWSRAAWREAPETTTCEAP